MLLALTNVYIKYWWMVKSSIFELCTTKYLKYITIYIYIILVVLKLNSIHDARSHVYKVLYFLVKYVFQFLNNSILNYIK